VNDKYEAHKNVFFAVFEVFAVQFWKEINREDRKDREEILAHLAAEQLDRVLDREEIAGLIGVSGKKCGY